MIDSTGRGIFQNLTINEVLDIEAKNDLPMPAVHSLVSEQKSLRQYRKMLLFFDLLS